MGHEENDADAGVKQEIGRRVAEIRGSQDQAEFASALGFAPGTVGRIERGERYPSPEFLLALRRVYNANPDWVLAGGLPKQVDVERAVREHSARVREEMHTRYQLSNAFELVPFYDLRTMKGYQALLKGADAPDARAFSRQWLKDEIRIEPLERLALVTVPGDNVPGLDDGEIVMMDRGDVEVLREGCYVFFLHDHIFIRRLGLRGNQLMIFSRDVEEELSTVRDDPSFRVIGRFVGRIIFIRQI